MVSDIRLKRIEKEMQRAIAMIIENAKDPHLTLVTITDVTLRQDLRIATVKYITHDKENVNKYLYKARGFIKMKLSEKVNLRYMPEIEFEYDSGIEYQEKINKIFEELDNEKDNTENKE